MRNNSLIGLLRKFLVKAETLEKSQGETEALRNLLRANSKPTAEYFQDVWAATAIGRHGYFVEFGAADGKTISNTYLLEKEFGWTGILAEPCRAFHSQLSYNRECIIDHTGRMDGDWRDEDVFRVTGCFFVRHFFNRISK
jgi:hypothetical protein